MNEQALKKRYLPMSETAYYILLSLTSEQHGYGIMQNVEQITEGRIRLGAGTLYGTLQKLEKEKLIEASREEDRRKFYKLTQTGLTLLRYELQRLSELVENGNRIVGVIK